MSHAEKDIKIVARAMAPELPKAETDHNYREDAVRVLDALAAAGRLSGEVELKAARWAVRVSALLVRVTDAQKVMARLLAARSGMEELAEASQEIAKLTGELAELMKEGTNANRPTADAG